MIHGSQVFLFGSYFLQYPINEFRNKVNSSTIQIVNSIRYYSLVSLIDKLNYSI